MTSARSLSITGHGAAPALAGFHGTAGVARADSSRVRLVKFCVVAAFALCMSAPEQLLAPIDPDALNPYTGTMKLILLVLGAVLVLLCRSSRYLKVIAAPFGWLMVWALVCWIVAGAQMLPLRNLVSSFGGILVLAGLCGAAEVVGGIRALVRLLVWALGMVAAASVLTGIVGLQAMPGELALPGQLELFHGIGTPAYMDAACACLIAWVLARHLANSADRVAGSMLLLLIIPALSFLRTYFIGIVATIVAAGLLGWWRRRKNHGQRRGVAKQFVLMVLASVALGSVVFLMKTGSREEGSELSGREIIWPIELASVAQHPWFGLGPFGDIQLLFFDEQLPQVGAAHSDYLGAAVCYGLPGLFLFVGALLSVSRRIRNFSPPTPGQRMCRDAAFLSMVGLSTIIIAENVIRDPRLFTLHLLFPALCLSANAAALKKVKQ